MADRAAVPLSGWRARAASWIAGLLVALVVGVVCFAAAAGVVLVSVPVIWAAEQIVAFWRWWAHVWGILGY